jgi:hypothetical protein
MYEGADPARGRVLLLVFITATLAISALTIAMYLALNQPSLADPAGRAAIATRVGRFLLTVLLMSMVYRGSVIAKWISIVLFGVTTLFMIPLALLNPILFAYVVIYGAFACVLLFSIDVLEYLEQRRQSRRESKSDDASQPPA